MPLKHKMFKSFITRVKTFVALKCYIVLAKFTEKWLGYVVTSIEWLVACVHCTTHLLGPPADIVATHKNV